MVAGVAQEVSDMLGAGRVGLYEFFWELNGPPPRVPRSEYVEHARAALDRVMATEDVVLVWHIWADGSYEEEADVSALDDPHVWDDPTDEPFLEVMPRGDLGYGPELAAKMAAKEAAKAARSARLPKIFGGSERS
ncbi:hypothetical protein [uncultured Jatrophihabitans sp.]|uniref:hypothetical protein n=1 Tax=uncultured Jatrophihabitans sp. TaxID=1610747 RepID=UPI0035CC3750